MKFKVIYHVLKASSLTKKSLGPEDVDDFQLFSDKEYHDAFDETELTEFLVSREDSDDITDGIEPSVELHKSDELWVFEIPGKEWPELSNELKFEAERLVTILEKLLAPYEIIL